MIEEIGLHRHQIDVVAHNHNCAITIISSISISSGILSVPLTCNHLLYQNFLLTKCLNLWVQTHLDVKTLKTRKRS